MFADARTRSLEREIAPTPDPDPVRRHWFDLAHELARTGRFRNVDEVEAALRARDESALPSRNKIVRSAIDIACLRARGEEGWHRHLDLQAAIPAGE